MRISLRLNHKLTCFVCAGSRSQDAHMTTWTFLHVAQHNKVQLRQNTYNMSQYRDISTHRMHTICIHCTTGTLLCNCTNIPTYSMKGIMSNTDVMHAIAHTYWCPFQLQVIFPFRSLISRRVHKTASGKSALYNVYWGTDAEYMVVNV